jgi:S1-C subfamily serine protease
MPPSPNVRPRARPGYGVVAALTLVAALLGGIAARFVPLGEAAPAAQQAPVRGVATDPLTVSPLVRQTSPAVVNIAVQQPSPLLQNPLLRDPFFRQYMGVPDEALRPVISSGSGVIVDAGDGLVVTNFHVVQNAQRVEIGLQDGRSFPAEPVAFAPELDLAVLRVRAGNLPALPLGDSAKLSVGDYVLAIGNPFGLGQTVTAGIVSAVDRGLGGPEDPRRFIQTDAPINPGNSGGALVNTQGQVIGINAALLSPNQSGNVGIGFAIPSNVVREVLEQARQASR